MHNTAFLKLPLRLSFAVCVTFLAIVISLSDFGDIWDRFTYDNMFRMRGEQISPEDIIVVAIDEPSFDEINQQWPWPRGLHATLLDKLFEAEVRAVGFDLLFAEPSNPEQDELLKQAIFRRSNVVLVNEINVIEDKEYGFLQEKIVNPSSLYHVEQSPHLGFANLSLDGDGFVRSLSFEQSGEKAFSLRLAEITKGPKGLEAIGNSKAYINFVGPTRSIKTISYYQALDPEKYLPESLLKGKIVLVGFATHSEVGGDKATTDHYPVPYTRWSGGYMPGVEIHANILANLLEGTFLRKIPPAKQLVFGGLLGLFLGTILLSMRPLFSLFLGAGVVFAGVFISYYYFSHNFLYVSPIYLLFPALCSVFISPFIHYWYARKQRAYLRGAFSTYVSPQLVERIVDSPEALTLGGREHQATVMFLDLAGFTSLSETLSPQELIAFVNRYLGKFAEIILEHDGMIDKYIGDCIMAVWGAPIEQDDHAIKSAKAVRDIIISMEEDTDCSVRIGIASGTVIAGNVGGGQQFNYTVLGNSVNLAARLESVNKFYGTKVILSEDTAKHIGGNTLLREIDTIRVQGQEQPVTIYELFTSEEHNILAQYAEGLKLYREKQWASAAESFKYLLKHFSEDGPSRVMLKRSEQYIHNPPSDWSRVFQMESK